jgi:hypothetical protein
LNTTRTPWEHHAYTTRTPRVHHANTMGTPWKHHANTTRTPCEHQPEDSLGFEIRAGTIQTEYRIRREQFKQNTEFGGNNSNRIRAGTIQTELDSNRIRAGTIRAGTIRAGTIQTGFGREQFKQNSGGNNSNRIRAGLNEFLNRGLGKLDPCPSLRTSVDNLQKWGTKTYLCLWKSILRSILSTTPFTTNFTT